MGSQIQYIDSAHKAKKYIRKSRIVCGLWIVFSIFYAIVTVMAFLSSDWIGNLDGESPGKFGPWGKCYATRTGEKCEGRVYDFYKMGNTAFSVASVCAFLSCLTAIASICAMLWFFFCETIRVYHVCGWLQLASGNFKIFLIIRIFITINKLFNIRLFTLCNINIINAPFYVTCI